VVCSWCLRSRPWLVSKQARRRKHFAARSRQRTAPVSAWCGTDGGVLPHGQHTKEFTALVDAGMPVIDAIRSATIGAARAFALDDHIGAIAAGPNADIIAVDGDPLRDVQALSRVVFVMQKGRVNVSPR
jgi:imidazolonepropionase-like amidohydrolase